MKKLSVVIPIFNAENMLIDSIERVSGELGALNIDYEILLRDDGSSDRSVVLMEELSIKYSHIRIFNNGKNYGIGFTLSKLFEDSYGDFTVRANSESVWETGHDAGSGFCGFCLHMMAKDD